MLWEKSQAFRYRNLGIRSRSLTRWIKDLSERTCFNCDRFVYFINKTSTLSLSSLPSPHSLFHIHVFFLLLFIPPHGGAVGSIEAPPRPGWREPPLRPPQRLFNRFYSRIASWRKLLIIAFYPAKDTKRKKERAFSETLSHVCQSPAKDLN